MGALEDIKRMQQMGQSEPEIINSLRERGYNQAQIENAISQTQIKQAVIFPSNSMQDPNSSPSEEMPAQDPSLSIPTREQARQSLGLQPSIMQGAQNPYSPEQQEFYPRESQIPYPPEPSPTVPEQTAVPYPQEYSEQMPYPQENPQTQEYYQESQEYPQEPYAQQEQGYEAQQYPQYQDNSISSDMISEIADQVLSEKLSSIRKQLEKNIDMKTSLEPRMANLDERLQRIEKILDRLQLSILQKVGEYGASVIDLKRELIETQKSFKASSDNEHTHHSSAHNNPAHHKKHK